MCAVLGQKVALLLCPRRALKPIQNTQTKESRWICRNWLGLCVSKILFLAHAFTKCRRNAPKCPKMAHVGAL